MLSTAWRIPSEVLPLQWRHVDFEARVVRLDPHTTKNDEGRTFPFTDALEQLLEAQKAEDVICPWVFNRTNKKVKGKRITTFIKAFRAACTKAGCPGRIPHDRRRTAVRNPVRAGIPERVAMQMTGHKTRSVFERYNIVSECDLVEAAKKLNLLQPRVFDANESSSVKANEFGRCSRNRPTYAWPQSAKPKVVCRTTTLPVYPFSPHQALPSARFNSFKSFSVSSRARTTSGSPFRFASVVHG